MTETCPGFGYLKLSLHLRPTISTIPSHVFQGAKASVSRVIHAVTQIITKLLTTDYKHLNESRLQGKFQNE